jgi:hypothetical protein
MPASQAEPCNWFAQRLLLNAGRYLGSKPGVGFFRSSSQQKMRVGSSPIDESTRISGYSALNEGIIMLPITAKPLTSRSEPRALLKKEKSIRYSPP